MIYCVRFAEFERFLRQQGYHLSAETERTLIYARGRVLATVRRPNFQGDITLQEIDLVCNAVGLSPPNFETHWCD